MQIIAVFWGSAPSRDARIYPRSAARNECSATLSGLSMPATHHPDRFTRFSWPISYTYLAMLFIKVPFLLLSFLIAAFLAERCRWFPDGCCSETLSARAAALCVKRVLLLLVVLKA